METQAGIEHVGEILDVPGVDILFIGTFDLTLSLGCPGDYGHREMTRSVQKALAVAGDHGKVAGMAVPSYELAEPWIKQGVRFFETMGDVGFIAQGSAELMKRFPGHGPGVAAG